MTTCRYCNMEVDGGRAGEHAACAAEWNRRYDANICTRCGEREAEPYGSACSTCISPGRPLRYHGYPGVMAE